MLLKNFWRKQMKVENFVRITVGDSLFAMTNAEAIELYNKLKTVLRIEDKPQTNLIPTPLLQYPPNVREVKRDTKNYDKYQW
jgi:hypothetical protein